MAYQTEYPFELLRGYIDSDGSLHKFGIMRLATAADEILPMRDPRVQANPGYLPVITLARVITRLGDLSSIDTRIIEGLFTADMAFLQDFYARINRGDVPRLCITCPACGRQIEYSPQELFER